MLRLRARLRWLATPMFAARPLSVILLGMLVVAIPAGAHDPSAYGGLFRSRDGGATWFTANPGRIVSGAIALAVSPVEPTHLLLATDSGLLRSRNAGRDWSLEAPSLLVGAVFAVTFDGEGRRALASTGSALFRSDGAQAWQPVAAPAAALPARLLVTDRPDRVYLVGWRQAYASDDWGTSWSAFASPLAEAPITTLLVARGRLYALAGERLWAKDAPASAWSPVDTGLPQDAIDVVAADAQSPARLWASARGQVFRSDDGGTRWVAWGRPIDAAHVSVRGIAVSPSAREAVLTTDRGLYRGGDEGRRWEILGDNVPAHLEAWPLVRDPGDPATLYAGFALIPYPELWRLAAERTGALARVGVMGFAGSIALLVLLGLAAALALRGLRRHDRRRRASVPAP